MIRLAELKDSSEIAKLSLKLWEYSEYFQMKKEFEDIINGENGCLFVSEINGKIVGFSHCELRHDYVEGTDSSPVGYLEGIFIEEEFRKYGIGKKLVEYCEKWSKEMGAVEFGSDCEINNIDSFNFHKSIGFVEANRIICFKKDI